MTVDGRRRRDALGHGPADVLPCSTGVIGEPLHMDALLGALPPLVGALAPDGGDDFARAIMTTDTVDKQATADAGALPRRRVREGRGDDRSQPRHDARLRDDRRCRAPRPTSSASPTSS